MERARKGKRSKTAGPDGSLIFSAIGDIFIGGTVRMIDGRIGESDERKNRAVFDRVLPHFHASDVNFANLEGPVSSAGKPQPGRSAALRGYPGIAEVLKRARFDFVSLANNHSLDYGWEALADTMEILGKNGIGFSGAGRDIAAARMPALVKKKGVTIGLLSYACNVNVPLGFQASEGKSGLAPIRISPFFWPDHTNRQDIEALCQDIEKWRKKVDFLAVSVHWGVSEGGTHTVALHQQAIGRQAIDAGADLILGHHPRAIQAIEIYKDKPICYSLGHFAFAFFTAEEGFPRETILFQCRISPHRVHEVSVLPAFIGENGQTEVLTPGIGRGLKIITLMKKLCAEQGTSLVIRDGAAAVVL
jgi:poly-gamma-glutamate synthesis protein (capsule biosynthesis protein)